MHAHLLLTSSGLLGPVAFVVLVKGHPVLAAVLLQIAAHLLGATRVDVFNSVFFFDPFKVGFALFLVPALVFVKVVAFFVLEVLELDFGVAFHVLLDQDPFFLIVEFSF